MIQQVIFRGKKGDMHFIFFLINGTYVLIFHNAKGDWIIKEKVCQDAGIQEINQLMHFTDPEEARRLTEKFTVEKN